MNSHEHSWTFMNFRELPWTPNKTWRCSWTNQYKFHGVHEQINANVMNFREHLWTPVNSYEHPWTSMNFHELPWTDENTKDQISWTNSWTMKGRSQNRSEFCPRWAFILVTLFVTPVEPRLYIPLGSQVSRFKLNRTCYVLGFKFLTPMKPVMFDLEWMHVADRCTHTKYGRWTRL